MNGYSKKDIGNTLNNAVLMSQNPSSSKKPMTDLRMINMRNYARALIQPALDHLEEGQITAEELVWVFSAAALWTHTFRILKTDKLPMIPSTKEFFEKRIKEAELPNIEVKCPKCKNKFEV